jgi:hypothetical protein
VFFDAVVGLGRAVARARDAVVAVRNGLVAAAALSAPVGLGRAIAGAWGAVVAVRDGLADGVILRAVVGLGRAVAGGSLVGGGVSLDEHAVITIGSTMQAKNKAIQSLFTVQS